MGEDSTRDRPSDMMDRITTAEAARRLGITEGAVRKRAQRGKILHEHDEDGRLWVWLPPGETRRVSPRDKPGQSRDERYITSLEDQVEYLRDQLDQERNASAELRRIVAGLTQRIPEIEPPRETPSEAPEARVTPSGSVPNTEAPPEAERAPWWRRVFGG